MFKDSLTMLLKSIVKSIWLFVFLFLIYIFIPVVIFLNTGNFIEMVTGVDKSEIAFLPMWAFLISTLYLYLANHFLTFHKAEKLR